MAYTKKISGQKLLVLVGDGASPTETFTASCLINTERGLERTANTATSEINDCDNPDAPAKIVREKTSVDTTISGAGKLHTPLIGEWDAWLVSEAPRNVRFKVDATAENGGGYWQGPFHLTQFSVNGTPKEAADVTVAFEQADAVTWVPAT